MMIEPPPPLRRIAGKQCFTERNTPSRLIAVCRRQSSSDISVIDGTEMPMPAFDTRMSSRPKRFSISATTSTQRGLAGHILMQEHRLMAGLLDAGDDLGPPELIDIGHRNRGALARQQLGDTPRRCPMRRR